MAYSTVAKIRKEAGFSRNLNITDSAIETHQTAATGIINGKLVTRYKLPITGDQPILEVIERYIAAGYLMLEEYGSGAEGSTKDGQSKVKKGEDLLELVVNGSIQLVDADSAILEKTATQTLRGFPDTSDEPIFTKDMVF